MHRHTLLAALSLSFFLFCPSLTGQHALGQGVESPGSPHSFSEPIAQKLEGATPASFGRARLCRVCHVPHDHLRAKDLVTRGLLWNRNLRGASYRIYRDDGLPETTASQPSGTSKMCLGCHDGTVASSIFERYASSRAYDTGYHEIRLAGEEPEERVLTHPISVVYDSSRNENLRPKEESFGGSGLIEDVLEGGKVLQCSGCHDIHDQPGESVPGTHLLRMEQKPSQDGRRGLCHICHRERP